MPYFAINFRASSGYVTDGTDETYCLGAADIYPVTRGGLTFGWDSTANLIQADRSTADRRFAGVNGCSNTNTRTLRVDLPSTGTWLVRLAAGDPTGGSFPYIRLQDNVTTFATSNFGELGSGQYADAAGGAFGTAAGWLAGNTAISRNFASSILRVLVGGANPSSSLLTHLSIESAGAPPAGPPAANSHRVGLAGRTTYGSKR